MSLNQNRYIKSRTPTIRASGKPHGLITQNERATLEQKKADENILRLAEDQQRGKEKLRRKIIELQKKLDAKQALELEVEGMSGALQVMKHMDDDGDVELMNKRVEIQQNLKEKIQDLEDLLSLNQALIIQERKSNDELQDARKELINEIIDEGDEKLKDLKTQFGDEVFLAVTIALMEMNEYNPSGTYIISKLWNYKEGRKATLGEGVLHLVKKWKAQKQKRN